METAGELERCREALRLAGPRAVLSHATAAQLLGIELMRGATKRHVTVPRNRSRLVVPGWSIARADVPADEIEHTNGLRATDAARTVADLARTLPTVEALVAADSAMRLGLVADHELRRRLATTVGSGARGVRLVGLHLDPRSGSLLETVLRWALVEAALPPPITQFRVVDELGDEVARVDFAWPQQRLVVEADGYAFHSDRFAYRRDRERCNGLVRLGWRVLRFTWEDVTRRPDHVTGLVRHLLAQAQAA